MAKGRPVDPTRAKRGTGNRPKPGEAKPARPVIPVVASELVPAEQFPPPATLPEEAHEVWRNVVADLGGANNMRASFGPAIEAYCMAVYTHAQATKRIQQYGVLITRAGETVVNPLLKVQKDAASTMLRFAETLGLTPAARIRLGLMEITGASLLATLNNTLDGKK